MRDKPLSIDWGTKGENMPIRKTHPFRIRARDRYSNPVSKEDKECSSTDMEISMESAIKRSKSKTEDTDTKGTDKEVDTKATDTKGTEHSAVPAAVYREESTRMMDKLIQANYVINAYIVLILNGFVMFLSIFLIVKLIATVNNDVIAKKHNRIDINRQAVEECRRQYTLNRCDPSERVPALDAQCKEWAECMSKNPMREEVTKIVFRVVSESIEEFFCAISIRSAFIATAITSILLKIALSAKKTQKSKETCKKKETNKEEDK